MTTQRVLTQPHTGDYSHLEPLPDPPREPDMQQNVGIYAFRSLLWAYFAHRYDVLIAGGDYLRHEATNNAERLAPDCVVTFGVNPSTIVERNGYVISEVGKPPDFVLEVASRSTGRRDYTVKRDGYAGYDVREYWRFDHTGGRFHAAPIAGDTLAGDVYEPVEIHEDIEGILWGHSVVLGLDVCWDDGQLRFRDPQTGSSCAHGRNCRLRRKQPIFQTKMSAPAVRKQRRELRRNERLASPPKPASQSWRQNYAGCKANSEKADR